MQRSMRRLARFFRIVPPVPLPVTLAFGAVTSVAGMALVIDPSRGSQVLLPVLVLQMLAASSGFAGPARRGHYDLLLTMGHGRLAMGLAHWAASVWPGLLGWTCLGLLDASLRGGTATPLFSSGTMLAMLLVSTVPWAGTAALPRWTGGITWLLVMATAFVVVPRSYWGTWAGPLICPWLLVGRDLSPADTLQLATGLAAAVAAMALALVWLGRMEVPLEAPP